MDWLCPGYSKVLARQLMHYHGNITAYNTIHDIVSIVQTGDLHVAVYDLSQQLLYVATARGDNESGPLCAYDRQVPSYMKCSVSVDSLIRSFLKLNMTNIFAEQPTNM